MLDDGGIWALDVDADARQFLGQRVTVEDTRSGFGRIDVVLIRLTEST
jgi:Protein of unknown function (DUF5818)